MRLKAIEEKYLLNGTIEEAEQKIQTALEDLGLKGISVKKHVPPRYLLIEYAPGWVGKALEIEFLFTKTEKGTEVTVKWPYTKEFRNEKESPYEFTQHQQEVQAKTQKLLEKFKKKIGAKAAT